MKKWFLILMTTFILTGCADSPSEDVTQSIQIEEQQTIHEYFCDKFMLTVDYKQFDLTAIDPEISSVSELYPITDEQLYILGRVDENCNSLMIYDFTKEEFIFAEHGITMCWVQDKFETVRYLKDNVVYNLSGNIIYQPEDTKLISSIEYVVEDFKVTVTNLEYENPEEIWVK